MERRVVPRPLQCGKQQLHVCQQREHGQPLLVRVLRQQYQVQHLANLAVLAGALNNVYESGITNACCWSDAWLSDELPAAFH